MLRASLIVVALAAASGCHTKPGTLPVDSPISEYRPPEMDDDDEDTDTDSSEQPLEEAAPTAGAGSAKP